MKFFADTANLEEIKYCFSRGVNDGITTNPKIMESTGDLSKGFESACKSILDKYQNVPVSLETDLRGLDVNRLEEFPEKVSEVLLSQAYKISKWQNNVVIKIPICTGGLMAAKELYKRGIKTNVTACMTPYQALQAAKAGVTYVSLFANRMLDGHIIELAGYNLNDVINSNWKEILQANKDKHFDEAWSKTLNQIAYVADRLEGMESELIIGSIRSPEDIYKLVEAQPQIITIPTKIVKGLENIADLKMTKRSISPRITDIGDSLSHPMTQYTLEEFEKAADAYRK